MSEYTITSPWWDRETAAQAICQMTSNQSADDHSVENWPYLRFMFFVKYYTEVKSRLHRMNRSRYYGPADASYLRPYLAVQGDAVLTNPEYPHAPCPGVMERKFSRITRPRVLRTMHQAMQTKRSNDLALTARALHLVHSNWRHKSRVPVGSWTQYLRKSLEVSPLDSGPHLFAEDIRGNRVSFTLECDGPRERVIARADSIEEMAGFLRSMEEVGLAQQIAPVHVDLSRFTQRFETEKLAVYLHSVNRHRWAAILVAGIKAYYMKHGSKPFSVGNTVVSYRSPNNTDIALFGFDAQMTLNFKMDDQELIVHYRGSIEEDDAEGEIQVASTSEAFTMYVAMQAI